MKFFTRSIILFVTVGSVAAAGAQENAEPARLEKMVLNLIDNRCSDTWCESGDVVNYHFQSFTCEVEPNCRIEFRVELESAGNRPKVTAATCSLTRLHRWSDVWHLVSGNPELSEASVADLNECLIF